MEIHFDGIVIIVGNYGSGKTEVSINLAVYHQRAGIRVSIGDLDLVNPYFRTREAREQLAGLGIRVLLPPAQYLNADLPILSPLIAGAIRDPGPLTILDVGGDHVGARVLAALAGALENRPVRMLQVVNPFRPFTETVDGCLKIKAEIEAAAGLKVGGWIGNANLIDETRIEDIRYGYEFAAGLAEASGLPLAMITAPAALAPLLAGDRFSCPVMAIERQLVPPWKRPVKLGPSNFVLHKG